MCPLTKLWETMQNITWLLIKLTKIQVCISSTFLLDFILYQRNCPLVLEADEFLSNVRNNVTIFIHLLCSRFSLIFPLFLQHRTSSGKIRKKMSHMIFNCEWRQDFSFIDLPTTNTWRPFIFKMRWWSCRWRRLKRTYTAQHSNLVKFIK